MFSYYQTELVKENALFSILYCTLTMYQIVVQLFGNPFLKIIYASFVCTHRELHLTSHPIWQLTAFPIMASSFLSSVTPWRECFLSYPHKSPVINTIHFFDEITRSQNLTTAGKPGPGCLHARNQWDFLSDCLLLFQLSFMLTGTGDGSWPWVPAPSRLEIQMGLQAPGFNQEKCWFLRTFFMWTC